MVVILDPHWLFRRLANNFPIISSFEYFSKILEVVDNVSEVNVHLHDNMVGMHLEQLILMYIDAYHGFSDLVDAFIGGDQGTPTLPQLFRE